MKKLDPQPPEEGGLTISGAGGRVREEVGPPGSGFPGAEEEASAGRDDKWVARTKRGGAQGWWRVEWPEGCGQWRRDYTALADLGFARYFPLWCPYCFAEEWF